ncbi:MAG: hypothetical protein A4E35_01825 [Methanoregula sp. PtaU1.Bin051]|nr:MAG: hypothetical protein A4E35_01825 [Methanoregula sp. PtaU1.Bin051]
MNNDNEYLPVLNYLYEKSLVLHDPALFNKVLYFYLIDSLAHIDYTISLYCYHYQSPKNVIGAEYLRWRIDEEKKGERALFPAFVNWLRLEQPSRFSELPSLWQMIYDSEDPASYRSFRIVLDPDSQNQIPADVLYAMIDEFFAQDFLKSLYDDASLASLFRQYTASCAEKQG